MVKNGTWGLRNNNNNHQQMDFAEFSSVVRQHFILQAHEGSCCIIQTKWNNLELMQPDVVKAVIGLELLSTSTCQ